MNLNNRIVKNASWIIVCRIIQAGLNLVVSMITARYLGPSNYGLITYASSIVAFIVPLVQLGINGILVQQFVEEPENTGELSERQRFLLWFLPFWVYWAYGRSHQL